MLLLALALAGTDLSADTLRRRPSPSDTASTGTIAVHRQPAFPIVTVRLSLLADDPPGYAGAGHLLQHLLLPSLREQIHQVGGSLQLSRSSDAVIYSATGPATELPFLADVLRSTLRPPRFSETAVLAAARALREERAAERETARLHARAALRVRLFPDDMPAAGTAASAARLTPEVLADVWAEMYRPERVSVLAVGDVELAAVQRVFSGLPETAVGSPLEFSPDTIPADSPGSPEATRNWIAIGYPAAEAAPAALTVVAHLLRDHLRERLPTAAVDAEHWWTRRDQALAALVAVPDRSLVAARAAVRGALAAIEEGLEEPEVRLATATVRREMLFYARTPERMAEVLGAFADRDGGDDGARLFFDALAELTEEEVRALLLVLAETPAILMEVPSQRLPSR